MKINECQEMIHDVLLSIEEGSETLENILWVEKSLPQAVKNLAKDWGWHDTAVREEIAEFIIGCKYTK